MYVVLTLPYPNWTILTHIILFRVACKKPPWFTPANTITNDNTIDLVLLIVNIIINLSTLSLIQLNDSVCLQMFKLECYILILSWVDTKLCSLCRRKYKTSLLYCSLDIFCISIFLLLLAIDNEIKNSFNVLNY